MDLSQLKERPPLTDWAWEQSPITPEGEPDASAFLLLLALVWHAPGTNGRASASMAQLLRMVHRTPDQLRDLLGQLEAQGFVDVINATPTAVEVVLHGG